MKVNVGSKNPQKVEAVREVFLDFPEYSNAEVFGMVVDTGVHKQPKSIEEVVSGAMNRARESFKGCDLSVGLESGLMKVPNTKSGYMEITMCAIYDGKTFHIGGSSSFEYPKAMIDLVFSKGYEIDQAAKEAGFTEEEDIGINQGVIGHISRGRLNRKGHAKQAVLTALVHLLNPEHY